MTVSAIDKRIGGFWYKTQGKVGKGTCRTRERNCDAQGENPLTARELERRTQKHAQGLICEDKEIETSGKREGLGTRKNEAINYS